LIFQLNPFRITIITNTKKNGGEEHSFWECKLMKQLWKAIWRFLQKLKIELTYDTVIPHTGIYMYIYIYIYMKAYDRAICTPMFI
jgi:hypothetical protein